MSVKATGGIPTPLAEAVDACLATFDRLFPIHPVLSLGDVWQAEAKVLLAEGKAH